MAIVRFQTRIADDRDRCKVLMHNPVGELGGHDPSHANIDGLGDEVEETIVDLGHVVG
ncbi:MAG: hypothetical protein ACRDLS_06300 [Solirubrobacteraceae bacterium]